MDVNIRFRNPISENDSKNLKILADTLENDYDLPVNCVRMDPKKGVKDGGLTIALSIASISISTIGTIISVLGYWKSQRPKYSISVESGSKTIAIEKVDPDSLRDVISELENSLIDANFVIGKN
jgi:hypothetical protein